MKQGIISGNEHTWKNFEVQMRNRKLIIFGANIVASVLLMRYPDIAIELVIDNSKRKQGHYLSDFLFGSINQGSGRQEVKSFDEIKKMDINECIVLVAAMTSYKDMIQQLKENGFYCCFSLNLMEKENPTLKGVKVQEYNRYLRELYVEQCQELEINPHKIVITDMGHYSGHGKPITEQLLKINQDIEIVWVLDDTSTQMPENVRKVWSGSLKYHVEMASAGFWLVGSNIFLTDKKRPEQTYIHMKHWASVTLKTFGFDFFEFRGIEDGLEITRHDCESIDYLIVGSKFDEDTCRKGYRYDGPVFYAGSPRSDILFKPAKYKEIVYQKYGIEDNKKILLYAPTFRGGTGKEYIYDSYSDIPDFKRLKRILDQNGEEWIILLRLHPVVAQKSHELSREDFVIDVSGYEDGEELVAACDMMISDYSSIMFEPAFVHKPVFLYAPDKLEYIDHERKLLIDYDTLPFDIAENDEELCCIIREFDQQLYDSRIDAFFKKYGVQEDGHASERAAKYIAELMNGGQKMTPLVSIIVPIYNTHKYLSQCLDSIVNQTYTNMEIILVNDGSTDESLSVCEGYAAKDVRIQVISQTNQGIIAAKRAGIKLCQGTYVMFVDSDDWIESELLEKMVNVMQKNDCSLVCTNVYMDLKDGTIEKRNAISPGVYDTAKIARDLFYYKDTDCYGILPYSVAKLYPRNMLEEVLNRVNDDVRYAEDKAIVFSFIFKNIKVCFTDDICYHYCVREESTTSIENMDYLIELTAFYKYAKEIFDRHEEREYLLQQLGKYLLQEVQYAVNNKLELTTEGTPIYREPYRLDSSVFFSAKKRVILYGAGKVGTDYQKQIAGCSNIELCGWVDKNYEKYQEREFEVKPVEYIQETEYDYILVAVWKQAVFNDIKNELAGMGIKEDAVIWGRPYGAPYEED